MQVGMKEKKKAKHWYRTKEFELPSTELLTNIIYAFDPHHPRFNSKSCTSIFAN